MQQKPEDYWIINIFITNLHQADFSDPLFLCKILCIRLMLKAKNETYESPEWELLEIVIEESILLTGTQIDPGEEDEYGEIE